VPRRGDAVSVAQAITVAALAIVPDDEGSVVFLRQRRGPYAGSWLLPGGKVEAGEDFAATAAREAAEEAGVHVGSLTPTGMYDIHGHTAAGPYRFLIAAFLAGPGSVRDSAGGHHVDEVRQVRPEQVVPHPTVMRILNDADVARYDPAQIDAELRAASITMRAYPISGSPDVSRVPQASIVAVPMSVAVIDDVERLMTLGDPYVRVRSASDYWLYATLFSSTCQVAIDDGMLVGAVVAMRSQDNPNDVYVQDVAVHPDHRRRGIATTLLGVVIARARRWGARRLYLTSEPDNTAAAATWRRLGFTNLPGDTTIGDVQVIADYKGPGKHRAVYQLDLSTRAPTARRGTGDPGE
jgi:8-oxo-dGTP pyrophosphatase MutT (NUDIX family)/GNAT superfamily N-acetyltransferase